jgi:hypothetical protein
MSAGLPGQSLDQNSEASAELQFFVGPWTRFPVIRSESPIHALSSDLVVTSGRSSKPNTGSHGAARDVKTGLII